MTLVETFADETDIEFRRAVDALLQEIAPDRLNWWHPYEIRGTYNTTSLMSPDQLIAADVQQHGYSLITISDIESPFAYTVGLMFTYDHPELILFGQRNSGAGILHGMTALIAGRPTVRRCPRIRWSACECEGGNQAGPSHAARILFGFRDGIFPGARS